MECLATNGTSISYSYSMSRDYLEIEGRKNIRVRGWGFPDLLNARNHTSFLYLKKPCKKINILSWNKKGS